MVAFLGGTVALAQWTTLSGLPALPAISLGFLLPNVDLLWVQRAALAAPDLTALTGAARAVLLHPGEMCAEAAVSLAWSISVASFCSFASVAASGCAAQL